MAKYTNYRKNTDENLLKKSIDKNAGGVV